MYFDVNPDAAHDIHDLAVVLLGQKMNFYTDAGVFSKKMIDYGSQVLLSALDFQEGESVLDVGCGYGPIGLSLAKAQGVLLIFYQQRVSNQSRSLWQSLRRVLHHPHHTI